MINKVILLGNLGADPETKYSASGTAICTMRLATSHGWKNATGEFQERTEWHRIVTFGKMAIACAENLAKGRQIYIEGRIQTNQWEDKDGNKRYTTEIVAAVVKFLGVKPIETTNNDQLYVEPSVPPIGNDEVPF